METREGFICLAMIGGKETAFGKRTGISLGSYDTLTVNGLQPFENQGQAEQARRELRLRIVEVGRVEIAALVIDIAETPAEQRALDPQGPFVVVVKQSWFHRVIGRASGSMWIGDPNASKELSLPDATQELEPLKSLAEAKARAQQIGYPARIATFKLTRLDPVP